MQYVLLAYTVIVILNCPRELFLGQHPNDAKPYKTSSCLWKVGAYFLSCYSELEKRRVSTLTDYIEKGTYIYFIHFILKKINRQGKCFSFMVNHWETFSEKRTCGFAGTLLYIQHGTGMDCGRELFILKALV